MALYGPNFAVPRTADDDSTQYQIKTRELNIGVYACHIIINPSESPDVAAFQAFPIPNQPETTHI